MTHTTTFLAQNTLAAETLAPADVAPYARPYSGNLCVLLAPVSAPSTYVKLHDSWGDLNTVVVHTYNADWAGPDLDPVENVEHYRTGAEALARFLVVAGGAR